MKETGPQKEVTTAVRRPVMTRRQFLTIDGKDIDDDKSYRIATIDYLSEGNDRMSAFAKHFDINSPSDESNDMRHIISNYFRTMEKNGIVVDAKIEGRVVVKGEK
mgnify:CR=1 FL=1